MLFSFNPWWPDRMQDVISISLYLLKLFIVPYHVISFVESFVGCWGEILFSSVWVECFLNVLDSNDLWHYLFNSIFSLFVFVWKACLLVRVGYWSHHYHVRGSLCNFNYSSVSFMELVSHHLVNKSSELEQSSMDNFPWMGICCPSIYLLISFDLKPVMSDTKITMPALLVLGSLCLGYPFPHLSPKEVSVLDWEAFFSVF